MLVVRRLSMSTFKLVMRVLFGVLFIVMGLFHFLIPELFVKIMPPYLPWQRQLVYLSGVCEAALGVLLLIPQFSVLAAWGLIALLIAVFPANLHMAMNPELYPNISPVVLWARLPLQGLLIAWAYWFTK
jgi:uncharacterized membrane protein